MSERPAWYHEGSECARSGTLCWFRLDIYFCEVIKYWTGSKTVLGQNEKCQCPGKIAGILRYFKVKYLDMTYLNLKTSRWIGNSGNFNVLGIVWETVYEPISEVVWNSHKLRSITLYIHEAYFLKNLVKHSRMSNTKLKSKGSEYFSPHPIFALKWEIEKKHLTVLMKP